MKQFITFMTLAFVLMFSACPRAIDDPEIIDPGDPQDYVMVSVRGTTVSSSIGAAGANGGAFSNASNTSVTVTDFKIGKTLVTYALWYDVKLWAEQNGYSFDKSGCEGNAGTAGAAPTAAKFEPVTTITFRDMVIWCNAYSEKTGKTPVYYDADTTTTVLKQSESSDMAAAESGKAENAYIKTDANGYRLPTEAEWEFAARGGDPGNSGNWNYTYAGSNTADDVGWYSGNAESKTHAIMQKTPNSLGLYDMSGNVYERCQGTSGNRVIKGGAYSNPVARLQCDYKTTSAAANSGGTAGFRLASN